MLFNFEQLATDKNGCQVVQECIKKANQDQRRKLTALCITHVKKLICHEFGNFVIQHALKTETQDEEAFLPIYDYISDNLAFLAKN